MIAGVPYDAEVEYIQNVYGSFLNLGFRATSAISLEMEITRPNNSVRFDMGNEQGWLQDIARLLIQESNYTRWCYGHSRSDTNVISSSNLVGKLLFHINGAYCKVNNITTGYTYEYTSNGTTPFVTPDGGFGVFGYILNGTAQYTSYNKDCQLHKLRIQDEGVNLDLTPVRFTNELGQTEGAMYDRVTKKLFRNKGTGSFIIGRDVAKPIMGLHFMKPRITAKSYVQDGLIAMWDGIENAGWGVHDPNATVWKDLSGNGYDITLKSGAHWLDNALAQETSGGFAVDASNKSFTYRTVEWVQGYTYVHIAFLGCGNPIYNVWWTGGSVKTGKTQGRTGIWMDFPLSTSYGAFVVDVDGNGVAAYKEGLPVPFGSAGTYYNFNISVGGLNTSRYALGKFYAARFHNRELSAAEIAANYAVDKARFNLPEVTA